MEYIEYSVVQRKRKAMKRNIKWESFCSIRKPDEYNVPIKKIRLFSMNGNFLMSRFV